MNIPLNKTRVDYIVKEVINKHIERYKPYIEYDEMVSEGCVDEGLIRTYPEQFVVDYIVKHFSNDLDSFSKEDNQLIMSLPKGHDSVDILQKKMDNFGWFCSVKTDDTDIDGNITLIFEPKFQDKITAQELSRYYEYIFHVTPEYNKDRILRNGLCPKSKNDKFRYPDRVYFFGNRISQKNLYLMSSLLWKTNKSKGKTDNYCVFIIDTRKLGDVKFQIDYNLDDHAFFTTDNVPKESIVNVQTINIPEIINYYNVNFEGSMDFNNQL